MSLLPPKQTSSVVSEQMVEYLLSEIANYAARHVSDKTDSHTNNNTNNTNHEQQLTVRAEMAAAKLERMGANVGYRLTELLASTKTWNVVQLAAQQQQNNTEQAVAAQQLEAVKFLCKEVWMELFHKQMDKLQTNHRGVFVLKDLEFQYLKQFDVSEVSRVAAIRYLAFPCGVLRGALANLGIPSVVSCDFLADGQNMAVCSFNIKVK